MIRPNMTAPPSILKTTSNSPIFNSVPKERLDKKLVSPLSKATSIFVLFNSGTIPISGIVTFWNEKFAVGLGCVNHKKVEIIMIIIPNTVGLKKDWPYLERW